MSSAEHGKIAVVVHYACLAFGLVEALRAGKDSAG